MTQDAAELEWTSTAEAPFAEAMPEAAPTPSAVGFEAFTESMTPFAENIGDAVNESEADRQFAEAFAELRDESFDEALAYLTDETEQAIADRFAGETAANAQERERFADSHLSAVRFEARQYLDNLEAGLSGRDIQSLTEDQLDETLDRLDPAPGELTPAGEEFIGKLIKKAKSVVKSVVKTAKNVAGGVVKTVGKVAGAVLGPILKKLKALIAPLLKRVLQFAIGRLPVPLQSAARTLASKITLEAEAEDEGIDEGPVSPANLTDVEALAESFDAALAEAITNDETEFESETFESFDNESDAGGRELELLAEARGVLIDRFRSANDEENMAPAIEQFVPALLGALRLGINIIGRPKVVGFLAKFLGQLIKRWVGPQLSKPLSNAIVDAGLKLVMLEAEGGAELRQDEAAPLALASVIEDTVRRLAESEDYVFENEDLVHLATSEAFSRAVATHFPPRFVRPGLQQAPSLGGAFITRRPRSLRPYRKYSRVPEIEVTGQMADALPTFGGATVGGVLRAAGATLPLRARVHIYQSTAGTSLPRMMRIDRAGAGRGYFNTSNVHPLTPAVAGMLLREPQLGAPVPAAYLRSRNRIAAGQRFYVLEPLGAAASLSLPATAAGRNAQARLAPSRAWTSVNLKRSRITVGFYFSEADAQGLAQAVRQGRGGAVLLQALTRAFKSIHRSATNPAGNVRIVREEGEDLEGFGDRAASLVPPGIAGQLRKRLGAWVMPALAAWTRDNAEAFLRAAAHPDAGVTIRVRLTGVPGLDVIGQAASGGALPTGISNSFRGNPAVSISVTPGRGKKK